MGRRVFHINDFSDIIAPCYDWRMNRIGELIAIVIKKEIKSNRQRNVLIGFFFDRMFQRVIGEKMGITRSTVREHIRRGKAMIGRIFKEEIDELERCDYVDII